MRADLLHVVTAVANPVRWRSRISLYNTFEQHMLESGVRLTTIECAYGERPFEIEPNAGVHLIQVRSNSLVWNKENLLNLAISRLPSDWKYVAWVDADVSFRRRHWATETVHALQHYSIVQPWSDAYDLGPNDEHMQHHKSFLSQWWHRQPVVPTQAKMWSFTGGPYAYPHSGYAWAATRAMLDEVGGLFEVAACGAADHHMALSLVGAAEQSLPGGVHPVYRQKLLQWQSRAMLHVNGRMGFVHGTLEHGFHGRKADRKYIDRWEMLVRHQFNPETDLKRNVFGVVELAQNKPELMHDMDLYFRQRNEDVNDLG